MALSIRRLNPTFGAEVSGVDLTRPIAPETQSEIIAAMDRYGVCVYRNTGLDDEGHVAFSRIFGELMQAPRMSGSKVRMPLPELFDAGNLDVEGRINADEMLRTHKRGDRQWHTDTSFMQARSAYSLLLAHEVPAVGGDTEFADMRGAYDALPQAMKDRIEDLIAEHSIWYSRMTAGYPFSEEEIAARGPAARHRIVQTHRGSGRNTLYIASHAMGVVGWPREEGRALLRELADFATQAQFVLRVVWGVGDLVIWDNRCTMHRATDFDDVSLRRDMRRTTVYEEARAPAPAH
jgi:alpha-ketoglutarate-dependent 2,4-dichlorophenoxyacetate dioxygenase